MLVAIVDYGSGNLRSAAKALERAAREAEIAAEIVVTGDAAKVGLADYIVLPGVGAFADCKRGLTALPSMIGMLNEQVIERGKPFLGICVGMQLMATRDSSSRPLPGSIGSPAMLRCWRRPTRN